MTTKTISIMEDVYRLLVARKGKGESFSDVLRKTFRKRRSVMQFAGAWSKISEKDIERMKGEVSKIRERSTRELLNAS